MRDFLGNIDKFYWYRNWLMLLFCISKTIIIKYIPLRKSEYENKQYWTDKDFLNGEYHEFIIYSLKNEQRKIQKQVWLRRKVCDNFFKSCLQLKDWFEWKKNKATNTRVKDFIKACKISTVKSSYSEIFTDAIKTFCKTLKILSRN